MRVIRTLVWIVITALLVAFIAMNWEKSPVNIWPVEGGYLHFDWPIGFIALVFFLLGLVPMWLLHKAGAWRLNRKISALENTVRVAAPSAPPLAAPTEDLARDVPATDIPSRDITATQEHSGKQTPLT